MELRANLTALNEVMLVSLGFPFLGYPETLGAFKVGKLEPDLMESS